MECIFDTCICGILFWAIGYAFMFSHGNAFIGKNWFFLSGTPETYEATGVPIFVVSMILMWLVSKLPFPWKLRVEPQGETGPGDLDQFEHGAEAYPMQAI